MRQETELLSAALRQAMLRFARMQLQPDEEAEDAVQEALLVLLQVPDRLLGAQEPKRYVFGMLKNKIADRLRHKYRQPSASVSVFADDLDVLDDAIDQALFDTKGHWAAGVGPLRWNTPENDLHSSQFFAVVDACMKHLPIKTAQVFSMKEFLEFEADDICDVLCLSKPAYWQHMSRARKQLQLCLNEQWFGERSQ